MIAISDFREILITLGHDAMTMLLKMWFYLMIVLTT